MQFITIAYDSPPAGMQFIIGAYESCTARMQFITIAYDSPPAGMQFINGAYY